MKLLIILATLFLSGCVTVPQAPVMFRDDADNCYIYQWGSSHRVEETYCIFSNVPRKFNLKREGNPNGKTV